ncbi:MAG: Mrp/NBP35 family ATP-binding protein [Chloroflexota bacterium]
MINGETVTLALQGVLDPELKRSLVELGMVRQVKVDDGQVDITLALTTLACPLKEQMVEDVRQTVKALDGVQQVNVSLVEMTPEEKQKLRPREPVSGQAAALNDIRYVLAVMSGKGGVGKSLVSALLAVALAKAGRRVGVLDADITGPSIPKMLLPAGTRPETSPAAFLPARTPSGIAVMSINLLLESEDQAVIWRGPLIGRAIQQFWGDVLWGRLDYLVVDLPPGTSDASLTVMQSLPMSGVVLVTSPQDLAGMVVRKAAQMARELNVPILGLIENMSYFVCPDTGKRHEIYGPSHAEETALHVGAPLLGRLPVDPAIATLCDQGAIEQYQAEGFDAIAERIVALAPTARPPLFPGK